MLDAAAGALARALIIDEKEGLVANDRDQPAEDAAKLVLPEGGSRQARRVGEEVIGVELVIAQELEQRAVIPVAAALMVALITAPAAWPNSAEKELVLTLNSCTASTRGCQPLLRPIAPVVTWCCYRCHPAAPRSKRIGRLPR